MPALPEDDVFCLAEIAAASGVSPAVVLDLAARGSVPTRSGPVRCRSTRWSGAKRPSTPCGLWPPATSSALACGRWSRWPRRCPVPAACRCWCRPACTVSRPSPIAAIASLGWSLRAELPADEVVSHEPVRLVYLALPGPGGGGGGGGLRQKLPPPKVQARGRALAEQPVAGARAAAASAHREAEATRSSSPPPIVAPIASAPADAQTTPACCARRPHRLSRRRAPATAVARAPGGAWVLARAADRASATDPAAAWAAALTARAVASSRHGCSRK